MKKSAKPVTTCQYQSVVSSCFMPAMCSRYVRYWR